MSETVSTFLQPPVASPAIASDRAREATALEVAARGSRWPLALAMGMLFLGALPDGTIAPLLHDLFVERYGVSAAAAHWFMAVNLIGALIALPLLARVRRVLPPSAMLAAAAACSALFLAAMALPIGFGWSLVLRIAEGAADLAMLAILFDLLSKAGAQRTRGARFGIAGTVLLLGVACGVIIGGGIARFSPAFVFCFGAAACLVVAAFALTRSAWFDGLVRSCPVVSEGGAIEASPSRSPLWPVMLMVGTDRAVAGVVATTLLLYFAHALEMAPAMRGGLLGGAILLLALGAWPAGLLADRLGHLRLRTLAAITYAASIMAIPFIAASQAGEAWPVGLMIAMACFGLSGAALMPAGMTLACRSGRGTVAMGAYHAGGNIGYHLLGIGGAAALLTVLNATQPAILAASPGAAIHPAAPMYHAVLFTFGAAHLAATVIAAIALRGARP